MYYVRGLNPRHVAQKANYFKEQQFKEQQFKALNNESLKSAEHFKEQHLNVYQKKVSKSRQ